jgi:hypothetical protein
MWDMRSGMVRKSCFGMMCGVGSYLWRLFFSELFLIACGNDAWVEENMQRQNGSIL